MLSDRITQLLTAYVDGELSARQQQAVLRLVQRSADARTLFQQLQQDAQQLQQLSRKVLPAQFADGVLRQLGPQNIKLPAPRLRTADAPVRVSWALAVAAMALIAVGLGSFLLLRTLRDEKLADNRSNPLLLAEGNSHKGGAGGRELVDPGEEKSGSPDIEVEGDIPPQPTAPPRVLPDQPPQPPASAPSKQSPLPAPVPTPVPTPDAFENRDNLPIALVLKMRELDNAPGREQLEKQLAKSSGQRVELTCAHLPSAIERLEAAFRSQGIHILFDSYAQNTLKLPGVPQPTYVLFAETLTASEIGTLLRQLASAPGKPGPARKGSDLFSSLIVSNMTTGDKHLLARLLGIDRSQVDTPRPPAPRSERLEKGVRGAIDIRRPISVTTGVEVPRLLQDQLRKKADLGKTVVKPNERLALVVAYDVPSLSSAQIRQFLDQRKVRQPGQMQLLLVLRNKN
jgi:hypothetical protein